MTQQEKADFMKNEIDTVRHILLEAIADEDYRELAGKYAVDHLINAVHELNLYKMKSSNKLKEKQLLGEQTPHWSAGTMTDRETTEILAKDIRQLRHDVMRVRSTPEYQKLLTKDITHSLTLSVNHIENYMHKADKRLREKGIIDSLDVFY